MMTRSRFRLFRSVVTGLLIFILSIYTVIWGASLIITGNILSVFTVIEVIIVALLCYVVYYDEDIFLSYELPGLDINLDRSTDNKLSSGDRIVGYSYLTGQVVLDVLCSRVDEFTSTVYVVGKYKGRVIDCSIQDIKYNNLLLVYRKMLLNYPNYYNYIRLEFDKLRKSLGNKLTIHELLLNLNIYEIGLNIFEYTYVTSVDKNFVIDKGIAPYRSPIVLKLV